MSSDPRALIESLRGRVPDQEPFDLVAGMKVPIMRVSKIEPGRFYKSIGGHRIFITKVDKIVMIDKDKIPYPWDLEGFIGLSVGAVPSRWRQSDGWNKEIALGVIVFNIDTEWRD